MHDVVIIGGGHNGLVCSAYLAMAGLKVLVLDQRPVAGGAAVTEEFSPGFRNSVASYAVSLLNPKIIRDLDLAVHGLRIVDRPVSNFLPLGAGSFLKVGGSRTKREVAKFSARDADRLDDYQRRLAAVADVLRASVLETPPNVVEGSPFSAKAGRIAKRIRALGLDLQRDLLDLFAASAGDFLDGWFESGPFKAVFEGGCGRCSRRQAEDLAGRDGSIVDFLMAATNFTVLVEVKRPDTRLFEERR